MAAFQNVVAQSRQAFVKNQVKDLDAAIESSKSEFLQYEEQMLNQAVQESEKLLDEQDVKKVLEIEERNELEKAKQASIKF